MKTTRYFSRPSGPATSLWGSLPMTTFIMLPTLLFVLFEMPASERVKSIALAVFLSAGINAVFLLRWRLPNEVVLRDEGMILRRPLGGELSIPWRSIVALEAEDSDWSVSGLRVRFSRPLKSILIPEEFHNFSGFCLVIQDYVKNFAPSARITGFTEEWPGDPGSRTARSRNWWMRQSEIRDRPQSLRGPVGSVLGFLLYAAGVYLAVSRQVEPWIAYTSGIAGVCLLTFAPMLWISDWKPREEI